MRISGLNSKCFIETELSLLRIDAVNDIFTVVFGEIYKEVWLPFSSKKNFICMVTYNFLSYFVILRYHCTSRKIKKGFVTFAMSDFTKSLL